MKVFLTSLFLFLAPTVAYAGTITISPTSLSLSPEAQSPMLTISNSGKAALKIQARLMLWTQDKDGKDLTEESKDLVFYPRQLSIPAGEERVIRVGSLKPIIGTSEKTYRIVLEEIAEVSAGNTHRFAVAMTARMSVPIYVSPPATIMKGEIGEINLTPKQIEIPVTNTGNSHFSIREIYVTGKNSEGKELCREDMGGWHLLKGITRKYLVKLPECSGTQPATWTVDLETVPPVKLSKTLVAISKGAI